MPDEPAAAHDTERPGHHWKQRERVREFVQRMDRREDDRRRQFDLMARLVRAPLDAPLRFLDIGAGYGACVSALLDRFPNASAVLLDVSEEMIRVGRERMAPFTGRYEYVVGDFADGLLPASAGDGYDAAVSSLAIHHVPAAGKLSLYTDVHRRLVPGGVFLNIDIVSAPTEELRELYRAVYEEERTERRDPSRPERPEGGRGASFEMQPLERHLAWLVEAGFERVDCFWKRLARALVGGYRPAAS